LDKRILEFIDFENLCQEDQGKILRELLDKLNLKVVAYKKYSYSETRFEVKGEQEAEDEFNEESKG
jgi:hypothetical protein